MSSSTSGFGSFSIAESGLGVHQEAVAGTQVLVGHEVSASSMTRSSSARAITRARLPSSSHLLERHDLALDLEVERLDDVHRLVEHDLLAALQLVRS